MVDYENTTCLLKQVKKKNTIGYFHDCIRDEVEQAKH